MKKDAEIVVGGRVFVISGHEDEEYLQKVGAYINGKIMEFMKEDSYKRLSKDQQNLLLDINIADEYFKAKYQIALLEEDLKAKEDEICNLKHELVNTKVQLDNFKKELETCKDAANEKERRLIRLETELKERDRR